MSMPTSEHSVLTHLPLIDPVVKRTVGLIRRSGRMQSYVAAELEKHAAEELRHALTISKHIDYLGGMPNATPRPVKLTDKAEEMLRADLQNENDTIRAYRERVRQCEALGEYAIAEDIREILRQEQEHQTDLATALGEDAPDLSR